jgi:hypothetical protein
MKQRFLNLKGFLMLAVGVVAMVGCTPPAPEIPTLPFLVIKDGSGAEVVNNQSINVAKEGGAIELNIESNRAWTVTSSDAWVTASEAAGKAGTKNVTFTAAVNDGESRIATVTVATTTDNVIKTFKIAQAGEVPQGSITLADIRAAGETSAIAEDGTLIVTVISDASNAGGNATSLQNIVVQDETAGIAIRLAAKPTDNQFAFGDVLSIQVKGLEVAKYQDLLQLNNVPLAAITETGTNVVSHKSITAAQLLSGDYESQLVAVADVQFVSSVIGKPIGTDAAHATLNMEAKSGEMLAAFVAKYSTFIGITVPEGSGAMKGIASINKGIMQILPQTAADFDGLTGERFGDGGGGDDPDPTGEITLSEIRAMGETTINENKTLVVTVISDASSAGGNSTSLQNIVVQDATAGIAIRLAAKPEENQYAYGDVLSINVKGIQVAKYQDLLQLNNVPLDAITETGTGSVTHKSITAAQLLSGNYESQLVAVADVQFASDVIGKPIGTDAAHATLNVEAKGGETFAAFFAKYSTFIGNNVPEGSGVIKGIASINKGIMQVLPQTAADLDGMTGERFNFTEADKFGVSKTEVGVSAAGGNATVGVTGNVAWTVAVKEGASYLAADPTPASGNGEGTVTLNFKENSSTEATPTVTITVSTTADVETKSFDVVFTQAAASSGGGGEPAGNLLFPGSDFNDWALFQTAINSYGLKDCEHSATGGRDGSGALYINTTPPGNDYVFTTVVPENVPNITKTISFYIKGTGGKSLSMNLYQNTDNKSYYKFNLGDCTADATLNEAASNQYTGTIDTGGNWVKVTLNVEGLDIARTVGQTSFFAIKVGKEVAYDLLIDDITFE